VSAVDGVELDDCGVIAVCGVYVVSDGDLSDKFPLWVFRKLSGRVTTIVSSKPFSSGSSASLSSEFISLHYGLSTTPRSSVSDSSGIESGGSKSSIEAGSNICPSSK